ncbi:MAG: tetraacyldisaccharide 4'-kinase [Rikenellaceae bacterium]
MIRDIILGAISQIYFLVIWVRHKLFDWGVIKSRRFEIPIICVGNITVGGTGKTPMSEMLIEHMQQHHTVALLSRGYGRTTKGYIEVKFDDESHRVGDEPLQMKRKFPSTVVVVCEKRVLGVELIQKFHPKVDLIIMDDGFQHRHIDPKIRIVMMDATRPVHRDKPLPAGELRDLPSALKRADYFVITKCPESMGDEERREIVDNIKPQVDQKLYFSKIATLEPQPIYDSNFTKAFDPEATVIAMAGVGNPDPFMETIRNRYTVASELLYSDHHEYTEADFEEIAEALKRSHASAIITTEKDAIKFIANDNIPSFIKERIYYTPIKLHFEEGLKEQLLKNLEQDVKAY